MNSKVTQDHHHTSRLMRGAILGVFALFGFVPAQAASLDISYDISLLGLPIGTATLNGEIGGERYSLEIRAKMVGLAGSITGGRGAGTATGVVSSSAMAATGIPATASFAVTAASSSEQRTVRMTIEKNAVSGADIAPPLEVRPDRVPVLDAHKQGVIDPISAMMMPISANDPRTACNRNIPIYDGAARYDILLRYSGVKQVESEGYKGQAVMCSVRYTPISGHRNRKPVRYMADNRDMQVWLAPVAGTNMMLPFKVMVKTMIGTTVIEATKYKVEPGVASAAKR